MEQPLFGIPPSDMASSFAQIATTLITLIEQVHSLKMLVVDIKPENFMLAYNSTKKSHPLHSRLRIIDVALFEKFLDAMTQKHRQDVYPNGPIVGTPVYASLNVLEGHAVSRRDDIEALGYVILEMLLMIHHDASVTSSDGKQEPIPVHGLLPWSSGKCDKDILNNKKSIMEGFLSTTKSSTKKSAAHSLSSSSFLDNLCQYGNESAAHALREYMALSRQLAYMDSPDYEALKKIVGKIVIHLPKKSATASSSSSSTDIKTSRAKAPSHGDIKPSRETASSSTNFVIFFRPPPRGGVLMPAS